MAKAKISLASLVLSAMILTGCGTGADLTTATDSNKVSALSVDNPVDTSNLANIDKAIDFATSTKLSYNNANVKFYMDGQNAYPALQDMIMNAKESIYIEVFLFQNDYTGKKFADALIQKVKEGVEVKVLYDYVGNTNVQLMNYMAKGGVQVETYNKQSFSSVGVNITHRKVFLIDGVRGMTGGMNIGNDISPILRTRSLG